MKEVKVRAIIPCAGLGTRMNMKPNESKEMLHDPVINGPVIQYSLDLCKKYDLDPLIVTRKEKTDLIKYCKKNKIQVLIIEPKGEWYNTVFQSKSQWNYHNILLLPDTRFNPEHIINEIKLALQLEAKSVIGLHLVDDSTKWCILDDYALIEKPMKKSKAMAMGIIGFNDNEGMRIFGSMTKNRKIHLSQSSFSYLTDFIDITRTGKIEDYSHNDSNKRK